MFCTSYSHPIKDQNIFGLFFIFFFFKQKTAYELLRSLVGSEMCIRDRIKRLASDLGIKNVYVVGNKVTSENDESLIREHLNGIELLGLMRYNEKVIEADKLGVSPYDIDMDIRYDVKTIVDALERIKGRG